MPCSGVVSFGSHLSFPEGLALEKERLLAHIGRMERERYIARRIQHWHVVRIGEDGQETVIEITDSEEAANGEAAKLDREAELRAKNKPPQAP